MASNTSRMSSSQAAVEALNRTLVTLYKLLGFLILGLVVFGLVVYIALNGFYFVHRSWTAPAILSPSDPRVLELSARFAQETALREKLLVERADLRAKLREADLTIRAEGRHLDVLERTIALESQARQKEIRRLRSLQRQLADTQTRFAASSQAFEDLSRDKLREQFKASLIDQHGFAAGSYQLAQMATQDLGLVERGTTLTSELERLERERASLSALKTSQGSLTYETAKLLHDLEKAELSLQAAEARREALEVAEQSLARVLGQYDTLLSQIEGTALLRAVRQKLTVSFVPYENLHNAKAGTPVFGCSFGIVICRQVAQVKGALEGEVNARHPLFGHDMRGQMVELEFSEPDWAEELVLHLGSAPIWF